MLLREVFKDDTSASNQIKLEIESNATACNEKRKLEEFAADDLQNSTKKVKTNDGVLDTPE